MSYKNFKKINKNTRNVVKSDISRKRGKKTWSIVFGRISPAPTYSEITVLLRLFSLYFFPLNARYNYYLNLYFFKAHSHNNSPKILIKWLKCLLSTIIWQQIPPHLNYPNGSSKCNTSVSITCPCALPPLQLSLLSLAQRPVSRRQRITQNLARFPFWAQEVSHEVEVLGVLQLGQYARPILKKKINRTAALTLSTRNKWQMQELVK